MNGAGACSFADSAARRSSIVSSPTARSSRASRAPLPPSPRALSGCRAAAESTSSARCGARFSLPRRTPPPARAVLGLCAPSGFRYAVHGSLGPAARRGDSPRG